MSTQKSTVDAVLSSLAPADVTAKSMFGEYGVYCDGRFVGVICDDTFYLKVSTVADARLVASELAAPYPGAKDCYVIAPGDLQDDQWLTGVVQATAAALPRAKRRSKRNSSPGG